MRLMYVCVCVCVCARCRLEYMPAERKRPLWSGVTVSSRRLYPQRREDGGAAEVRAGKSARGRTLSVCSNKNKYLDSTVRIIEKSRVDSQVKCFFLSYTLQYIQGWFSWEKMINSHNTRNFVVETNTNEIWDSSQYYFLFFGNMYDGVFII